MSNWCLMPNIYSYRYRKFTYYTPQDFGVPSAPYSDVAGEVTLEYFLSAMRNDNKTTTWLDGFKKYVDITNDICSELIFDIITRYYRMYAFYIVTYADEEPSEEELGIARLKWVYRFLSILKKTYPYYNALITAYNNASTELMADISTSVKTASTFNDTPQNINTGDIYEGDEYISNYGKTEQVSTTPLTTKMARLEEIQRNYKRVMSDWVEEFRPLFLENVDEMEVEDV